MNINNLESAEKINFNTDSEIKTDEPEPKILSEIQTTKSKIYIIIKIKESNNFSNYKDKSQTTNITNLKNISV
jgi:hypothetical protein